MKVKCESCVVFFNDDSRSFFDGFRSYTTLRNKKKLFSALKISNNLQQLVSNTQYIQNLTAIQVVKYKKLEWTPDTDEFVCPSLIE